jgi:[ribosomal protein S5]-alanine N-acetyltransferase
MIKIDEHLSITEFLPEFDKEDLIYHINDIDVAKNTLTIPHPYSSDDADFYFNLVKDLDEKYGIPTTFAIRYDGKLIGGIGRFVSFGIDSHKDEIGYYIGKDFRNKGLMTKAVVAFCQYLNEQYGLIRIEAGVFVHNQASMSVLTKAGFEYEGLRKKYHKKGDDYLDAMMFVKIYQK